MVYVQHAVERCDRGAGGVMHQCIRSRATAPVVALISSSVLPTVAQAHVKWFCAFSVAGQPEGLGNILCQDFESLSLIALAALLFGALVDRSFIGDKMNRALDRVFGVIAVQPDVMVRAGVGLMMVASWTIGGVILTPELTTTSPYIPWAQVAIAACLVDKRTLPVAALGIVGLWVTALVNYGAFHLADYPVFLGVAAFLFATGLGKTLFGVRPLDVLRWSISVTLMWASVEKWAYPEWSYPLFVAHPGMSMGFDPAYYMRAAGVVEFALAFALILTPFTRRVAAIMLVAIFISAIAGFGKTDAIGHAGVIGVLFALILDDAKRRASLREVALIPAGFATALAGFIALYYGGHAVIYGTAIV